MAKKKEPEIQKRKSTRFPPDPLTVATLQLSGLSSLYKPDHVGLIVNESYTGTCLVVQTEKKPKPEQKIKLKVGRLSTLKGEIIWVRQLDLDLYKLGVQYSE